MRAARIVVTAKNDRWAREAALKFTGFATSVIACKCEAAIERTLAPEETPDARPGVSILLFTMDTESLRQTAHRAHRADGAHLSDDELRKCAWECEARRRCLSLHVAWPLPTKRRIAPTLRLTTSRLRAVVSGVNAVSDRTRRAEQRGDRPGDARRDRCAVALRSARGSACNYGATSASTTRWQIHRGGRRERIRRHSPRCAMPRRALPLDVICVSAGSTLRPCRARRARRPARWFWLLKSGAVWRLATV